MTVFIKVKVRERLPEKKIKHLGLINIFGYIESIQYNNTKSDKDTLLKCAEYWLEEIELPSEEEITIEADKIDNWKESYEFERGANFILNKLKGE